LLKSNVGLPIILGAKMIKAFFTGKSRKPIIGLFVAALAVGGISAQATGVLNTPSSGYLLCINSKTKVVTHPGTSTCPKGSKTLVLGAQGVAGIDGKTLWNGVKDPESTLGAPGDMFINTTTNTLFGPKDLTTGWPAGISIVGPTGATGARGATGSNATLTCAQGGTCALGDTGPGGGIVFIVQTPTAIAPWRYMEAAPNTWGGDVADPWVRWCSKTAIFVSSLTNGQSVTRNTSTALGSGFKNTKMMLGSCGYGAGNMAASYNGGGKSDWFLPSKDELNQLYLQKAIVGGFVESSYYSSSEVDSSMAYYHDFLNGTPSGTGKVDLGYVRPVRAF